MSIIKKLDTNAYVSTGTMLPVSRLLNRRAKQLTQRLYNLKWFDVAEQDQYEKTLAFIKETVVLKPVVFGKPSFSGCIKGDNDTFLARLEDKVKGVVIQRVSFPFTGSKELFRYTPDKGYISDTKNIVMPYGHCLTVKLDSVFFNRAQALNAARKMLRDTFRMIEQNNRAIEKWAALTCHRIDCELETYSREHDDLSDPNGLLMLLQNLY